MAFKIQPIGEILPNLVTPIWTPKSVIGNFYFLRRHRTHRTVRSIFVSPSVRLESFVVTDVTTTTSVARLNDFFNFLATNCVTKVSLMFVDFLGSCEKHCFSSKTGQATFWVTFGKSWVPFYFNIWSHWLQQQQQYVVDRDG